jgi:large subunit ribosomal protein L4e
MAEKKKSKEPKKAEKKEPKPSKSKTVSVLTLKGKPKGETALPDVFETDFRPDLIQRAVVAEQSWARQPYGSDVRAGFRTTADYYSRRRDAYRMTMNRGMSRLPRVKVPKGKLGNVKRVPQSKGGHRAHPPKAERIWCKKMNQKEWRLALGSAIAATNDLDLVTGGGRSHNVSGLNLPLIIESAFEKLEKTGDVYEVFTALGLDGDLGKVEKKTKAGVGKSRDRRTKTRKSVLVVLSADCKALKAASNIAGVDVSTVDDMTVDLLAPGGYPGRLTLWTEASITKLQSQ